jgi:hypothetical protein
MKPVGAMESRRKRKMLDLVLMLITVVFFGLCIAYTEGLERMGGNPR